MIGRKTARQRRLYHELFDVYEANGSLASWNFAFDLVKLREMTEREANALMEEISACFDIG